MHDLMTTSNRITYLSEPAQVNMADKWYEVASLDHFWIRRRFRVLQRLAGGLISGAHAIAEIGCGNGLLQRQIEDAYSRDLAGFDLNQFALNRNVSRRSFLYCYDILQKDMRFKEKFDLIILFDVIEHIDNEDSFLEALKFHLAPAGHVIVNVPAGRWAYSEYDSAAGHVRRYSASSLFAAAKRSNFYSTSWTYWGLSLIPAVLVRKLWLRGRRDHDEIIKAGLDSRNKSVDQLMSIVAACEFIPQKLIGTSLMAVFERRD